MPLFQPGDPIHWNTDNVPLRNLITRQELINSALDDVIEQIRDAVGTQNTISNRLNQSIEPDGSLKKQAIDDALHSIEDHVDTDDYVRMTAAQSSKLDLIENEANKIVLHLVSDDDTIELTSGIIKFQSSDLVKLSYVSPNIVKYTLSFPTSSVHQHYYGLEPVHFNLANPDFKNYQVNSISSSFIEDSLRIYINGMRIFSDVDIYVPGALVDDPWTLLSFTPDYEEGTFVLSTAITEDDVIRIDFDISQV